VRRALDTKSADTDPLTNTALLALPYNVYAIRGIKIHQNTYVHNLGKKLVCSVWINYPDSMIIFTYLTP